MRAELRISEGWVSYPNKDIAKINEKFDIVFSGGGELDLFKPGWLSLVERRTHRVLRCYRSREIRRSRVQTPSPASIY